MAGQSSINKTGVFEKLMEEAGIYLLDTFGDYKLKKFHKSESERLIMIFK